MSERDGDRDAGRPGPRRVVPAGDEAPTSTPGQSGARVGRRTTALLVVAALVVASGWWLDEVGARPAGAASPGPPTGAWFCPHGGSKGWKAWVVLTNPGPAPSTVRVTSYGASGAARSTTFSVPARRQVYRSTPAGTLEASTEVEYFGGWVAAEAVLQTAGGALAAERCQSAPHPSWFLPDVSTAPGRTSYVVVMNPFDANAEFNVVLRTERRAVRPGPLTPQVLRPGRSVAIKVNSFVLGGPGEQTVTAQVQPVIGRVIAGSVGVSTGSLRAEEGQPNASSSQVIPAAGYGSAGFLQILNPGPKDARLSVTQIGPTGQRTVPTVPSVLPSGRAMTVPLTGFPDASDVVATRGGAVVAAALRAEGPSTDDATIGAAGPPSGAWVVAPPTPPGGGTETLVLVNPGRRAVPVKLQLIGPSGQSGESTESVPPGRTLLVPLSTLSGPQPTSVVVAAGGRGVVAGAVATTASGTGFAATTGVPIPK